MNRTLRVVLLILWFELGIVLIVLPWSEIWVVNYFVYRYSAFALFIQNPFVRGAISGLGIINVLCAVQSFRQRTTPVAARA